ncbi:MAG: uroporphyrinogen-III C-methyltransferase [Caulobacterales bacterium]
MSAKVFLVGAGPGAADLLTLRAARILAQADYVLHDALVSPEILELCGNARNIAVGKRGGRPSTDQAVINRLLVSAAKRFKCVVRLKGGDPMVFGRADEELAACRAAGISVEVVAGISAGFAAAAALGAPLTKRGVARSLTLLTPARARGACNDESWADAAQGAQTLAIYMGRSEAAGVRAALQARGWRAATPVVLAESVSLPEQSFHGGRLDELDALCAQMGEGPALLLIGEVFEAQARANSIGGAWARRA